MAIPALSAQGSDYNRQANKIGLHSYLSQEFTPILLASRLCAALASLRVKQCLRLFRLEREVLS